MDKKRCTAIILAAGSGSRMKSQVAKQFMPLAGKPLVWYALHAVEASNIIDDCILVTGESDISYMQEKIVEKYGFYKVKSIIAGGLERCFSVANALQKLKEEYDEVAQERYVFIHDGARPFLTEEILRDTYEAVQRYHACVAAVPVKDTIKVADSDGFAAKTPDRNLLWSIQTPQVFDLKLITEAYEKLLEQWDILLQRGIRVTDDGGVAELFSDTKVKLVLSSYCNIKITTPEDFMVAEAFLKSEKGQEMA